MLKIEGVQSRRKKNAGSKWTEDRKKRHSENEKMKEYWRKRKEQGREIELACGPQTPDTNRKKKVINK